MNERRVSRIVDYKGSKVEVILGYDRILDYFYMVIFNHPGENVLYSNLNDKENSFPRSLEGYANKLKELGIDIPKEVFDVVLQFRLDEVL